MSVSKSKKTSLSTSTAMETLIPSHHPLSFMVERMRADQWHRYKNRPTLFIFRPCRFLMNRWQRIYIPPLMIWIIFWLSTAGSGSSTIILKNNSESGNEIEIGIALLPYDLLFCSDVPKYYYIFIIMNDITRKLENKKTSRVFFNW